LPTQIPQNPIPHLYLDSLVRAGLIRLNSTLRLVNGSTPYSGRLEMLREGVWAPVGATTTTTLRQIVAELACQQLGFVNNTGSPVVEDSTTVFGQPVPGPWFEVTSCSGDEALLQSCLSTLLPGDPIPVPGATRPAKSIAEDQMAITCPTPSEWAGM